MLKRTMTPNVYILSTRNACIVNKAMCCLHNPNVFKSVHTDITIHNLFAKNVKKVASNVLMIRYVYNVTRNITCKMANVLVSVQISTLVRIVLGNV